MNISKFEFRCKSTEKTKPDNYYYRALYNPKS